jgi:DNA-binding IclR family transcriptional regulator
MDILLELAQSDAGLSLAELTVRLDLPKTSVLNLLRSFVEGRYILNRNGRYVLGAETYRLAALVGRRRAFPGSLRPILERLASDTLETAMIGILRDDGLSIELIDVVESARALRYMTRVGHVIAAHASSVGEAVIAFLGREAQEQFLRRSDFRSYTTHTPDRREFKSRLAQVRKSGIAKNIQGQDVDLYGISAPVFDDHMHVVCAVCVGGPISRLEDNEQNICNMLTQAASEMSAVLGLSASYADALEHSG